MEAKSCVRFNPQTGEVEIMGSEKFIKTMLNKIQEISGVQTGITKESVWPTRKAKKKSKPEAMPYTDVRKLLKVQKKAPEITMFDKVVGIIQASSGVTTSELKKQTGFTEKQIWSIIYRAAKMGKIRIAKKGIYESAA